MKRLLLILFLSFAAVSAYGQSRDGIGVTSTIHAKKVTISPNPALADVKITVEGSQLGVKSISVYSIIGSEVMTQSFKSASKDIELNVRSLKKGKYMVRVIFEDNSTEVATLIKQ